MGVKLIERTQTLEFGLEAVRLLDSLTDFYDVLPVTEDCRASASHEPQLSLRTHSHFCSPTALRSRATAAVYFAESPYVVDSNFSSPDPQ